MTLERAAVMNLYFAPFAVAGGAGLTLAQGGPWYAGGAGGCLLVFTVWVIAEWLILSGPRDTTMDTTSEPEPAPLAPALNGWTALASETRPFVPPDRIMLQVVNRLIPLKMTPEQARYLAAQIMTGKRKIGYDLYGYGKPFRRGDVDRLRIDLVRKWLAEQQGSQVILTDDCARALVEQFPSPAAHH